MEKLTLPAVCDLAKGQDIREIKTLSASRKNIKRVDDISPCVELEKLNMSHNIISSVDGFKYCCTLTWLDISHNQLESLSDIQSLVNLTVLNAGHNKIHTVGNISALKALKALILNNNDISSITGLSALKKLNALVLSHNQLEDLSLDNLSALTKLSLSHNLLRACPNTKDCLKLKELRLNNNRIFGDLPNTLSNNQSLEIMDIGNNLLSTWNSCHVLRQLKALHNLNINGNKFSTGQFYKQVLDDLPSLEILNGKKRTSYSVTKQAAGSTSDEQLRQPETSTSRGASSIMTAQSNETTCTAKSPGSKVKRVKLKEPIASDNFPAKKLKHDDRTEDSESERFSIAAISGEIVQSSESTSKGKRQKVKSVTGVISLSKPKVRRSKKDMDISKLNNSSVFGTGQTTQWF